ncbi:hypothetical protein V6N11_066517 [Hibiscus sabdariffa]|uniref:Protein kinase domain-containing protein n=1 Tax=Hibiscus sabdariffa TaxID=183260 RepID=A0ABR2ACK7_9ROSI
MWFNGALNSNNFTGGIPPSFGKLSKLYWLDVADNQLVGTIPVSTPSSPGLDLLLKAKHLNLAHNNLTGPLPDLASMNTLNYVDLSNNSFDPTEAPVWFSTLSLLTTLVIEHGSLQGPVPEKLFSFPQIQQVVGSQLQLVDLQNNQISSITLGSGYRNTLILIGNPVCTTVISNMNFCQIQQQNTKPYYTSLANCGSKSFPIDQKLSPQSCECAYPFEGTLYFRELMFRELSNVNMFHSLEMSLWVKLGLTPGSLFLRNPFFNVEDYLQIQLAPFPSGGEYFNRSEVLKIGFDLNNQTYKPPPEFGPYYFIASPYTFPASHGTSVSTRVIIGVATGAGVLVLGLSGVGIYAIRQKKRAEKAIRLSKPFSSWAPSGKDSGGAPQLKGARWFSYDELKKCTNNFSESNELGYGGYVNVYRGTLSDGQTVAIKRAQHGSMQGRSGIHLDWKRRLRIALGSARGLAYLQELANPPIIHRDIKSTIILLDENLTMKVADFGLSKLVSDSSKGHVSTQVKGTLVRTF